MNCPRAPRPSLMQVWCRWVLVLLGQAFHNLPIKLVISALVVVILSSLVMIALGHGAAKVQMFLT